NNAIFFQRSRCNFSAVFETVKIAQVYNSVFFTVDVREPAFRNSAEQWKLSTFECQTNTATGTGVLSIVSTTGCFTVTGRHTASYTVAIFTSAFYRLHLM